MTHSKTARQRWLNTNCKRPLLPPPSRLGSGSVCVDMLDMLDMLTADTEIWDEFDADSLSLSLLASSLSALLARRARLGTPAQPSAHTLGSHTWVTHLVTHLVTHHAITQEAQTKSTPPRQNDQENVGAALRCKRVGHGSTRGLGP